MKTVVQSDRGFRRVEIGGETIVAESSGVGDYDDSLERPGSSFLWTFAVGQIDREEVAGLVTVLQHWLEHKRLPPPEEESK